MHNCNSRLGLSIPLGFTTDPAAHDAWFRAKVREALDDPRPTNPAATVDAHFAARRKAAARKIAKAR